MEYRVVAYKPNIKGCFSTDKGWDEKRCQDFQDFINSYAKDGWKLHSCEYRNVKVEGCLGGFGTLLVCIFERQK